MSVKRLIPVSAMKFLQILASSGRTQALSQQQTECRGLAQENALLRSQLKLGAAPDGLREVPPPLPPPPKSRCILNGCCVSLTDTDP